MFDASKNPLGRMANSHASHNSQTILPVMLVISNRVPLELGSVLPINNNNILEKTLSNQFLTAKGCMSEGINRKNLLIAFRASPFKHRKFRWKKTPR